MWLTLSKSQPMSRLFYVVLIAREFDNQGLGYILFVMNQFIFFFGLPLTVLEKSFKSVAELDLRNGLSFMIGLMLILVFDLFCYFNKDAQKRVLMKYNYEFVHQKPVWSFFLFLFIPFIIFGYITVLIFQNA